MLFFIFFILYKQIADLYEDDNSLKAINQSIWDTAVYSVTFTTPEVLTSTSYAIVTTAQQGRFYASDTIYTVDK